MVQSTSFAENIQRAEQDASRQNWPGAADHYARALLDEPSAPVLVQYGHMLKEAGFLENAARAYRAATELDGTDTDAHLQLGHLLKRLGLADEALSVFQALEKIPFAPYIRPEIDGLIVARMNADQLRASPQMAAGALPAMPEGLRQADMALGEKLVKDASSRRTRSSKTRSPRPAGRSVFSMSVPIAASLQPVAHIVLEDGIYRATTDDPKMRIEIMRPFDLSDLDDSWIELSLRIDARDMIIDPVLLVAHQAGWTDFTAVRLTRRSSHLFGATVHLRGPVVGLRLDPLHSVGTFSISELRVAKLSRPSVLLRAISQRGPGLVSSLLQARMSGGKGWKAVLEDHFRPPPEDLYKRWIDRFEKTPQADLAVAPQSKAGIGLLLPVTDGDLSAFSATLASLKAQAGSHWELVVIVARNASDKLRDRISQDAGKDQRVRVLDVDPQLPVGDRLELGRKALRTELIGHIAPGDRLSTEAVKAFSSRFAEHANLRILYCDDDMIDAAMQRSSPRFKPDWNADYCYTHDYIGRSLLFSAAAIGAAGGYRSRFPGSEDFDLLLRVSSIGEARDIGHIARPLWHCASRPAAPDIQPAVSEFLFARQPGISVRPGTAAGTLKLVWAMPADPPHVTIIIPTRDRIDLLKRAVETIRTLTDYPSFDILVVDNGSVEAESLDYFAALDQADNVSVLRDDGPFNFSRLNNRAAGIASGAVLALVNNDVEVVERQWLSEMVAMALDPGIGAVGAKLLYASGHVQHAGILGGVGAVTAHGHKYSPGDAAGYMNRLAVQQAVTAVTAACLVVETAKYRAVGGLDEDNLTVGFNDVDLCLKLAARGWRTMFTPWARLHHHESLSRGLDTSGAQAARFKSEGDHMIAKWGTTLMQDPFYSPSLTRNYEDFSLSIVDVAGVSRP